MRTVFAFLTLISLLLVLFAGRDVVARKDLGGYWKNVMDSQQMPEAIQGRIHPQTGKGVHFAKDFDPAFQKNIYWHVGGRGAGDLIHPEARPKAENLPISKAEP